MSTTCTEAVGGLAWSHTGVASGLCALAGMARASRPTAATAPVVSALLAQLREAELAAMEPSELLRIPTVALPTGESPARRMAEDYSLVWVTFRRVRVSTS